MTRALKSLSTGQEGIKMPDETKEIFDQETSVKSGEASVTTEVIDSRAVEIGTNYGVGELPENITKQDKQKLAATREGLKVSSQKVPSIEEINAQISTEEEVSGSQVNANRERAKGKEGLMIKFSRTRLGKPIVFGFTAALSFLGIGGSVEAVKHMRSSDVVAEKADYGRDKTAMDTEIDNMISQLQNPNISEEKRASLEEHLEERKEMRDNLVVRHNEYTNKYGNEQPVEVADGTQYQNSTENKSE